MSAARFIFTAMGVVLILMGLATAALEMTTKARHPPRTNSLVGRVLHHITVQSIIMMGLGAAIIAATTFIPD
jgi:hypothetical protein